MASQDVNEPQDELHLVNRLSASRSPYVRGHMNNPVAWQMWDSEALGAAKIHNRLIFVSIGYAACHWCHVMERESFESPEVAELLNKHFIPIKIDREERPDIDSVYMSYVQATSGSGGWPLNVFLTPQLEPVFGGTYFPGPKPAPIGARKTLGDHATLVDILERLRQIWEEQEDKCRTSAKEVTTQLRKFAEEGSHGQCTGTSDGEGLEIELLEEACSHFKRRYDRTNGGFSSAPKFPTPINLKFLLHLAQWPDAVTDVVGGEDCTTAREMVLHTLRKMARGGIRDQIGYGFSRYSVTKDWSLPHFEKMLYDQAQLLDVYLDAFLVSHDPEMLGAVLDISTYLTTMPMSSETGGFFSAEDADSYPTKDDISHKREGAYYVWTRNELEDVLGSQASNILATFYGVEAKGNVSGHNDPHNELQGQNVFKINSTPPIIARDLGVSEDTITNIIRSSRQKLREYRNAHRPRPALDDKIVVCWNGLAIGALARAASILQDIAPEKASTCLSSALSAVDFIKRELFDADNRILYRVYRSGRGDTLGMCDDYAFMVQGLIDLYEATFDDQHLQFADTLQSIQLERFRDVDGGGGFFTTPSPHPPDVLLRLKNGMDAAEPSSNSVSARNLWRLSSMLEDEGYADMAKETLGAFEAEVEQFPYTFAGILGSVVMGRLGLRGVILIGGAKEHKDVLKKIRGCVRPNTTIVAIDEVRGGWLRERNQLLRGTDPKGVQVMVCEGKTCHIGAEHI